MALRHVFLGGAKRSKFNSYSATGSAQDDAVVTDKASLAGIPRDIDQEFFNAVDAEALHISITNSILTIFDTSTDRWTNVICAARVWIEPSKNPDANSI